MILGQCGDASCTDRAVLQMQASIELPGGNGQVQNVQALACLQHAQACLEQLGGFVLGQLGYANGHDGLDGVAEHVPAPEEEIGVRAYAVVSKRGPWVEEIVSTHDTFSDAVLASGPGLEVGAMAWAVAAITDRQLVDLLDGHAGADESLRGRREILTGPYKGSEVTL